jgi:hypothetical protein
LEKPLCPYSVKEMPLHSKEQVEDHFFSNESKIHASQFLVRFVRRYANEELEEEYC